MARPTKRHFGWRSAAWHTAAALALGTFGSVACGSDDGGNPTPKLDSGIPLDAGSSGGNTDVARQCASSERLCNGACATIQSSDDRCGAGSCAVACNGGTHCQAGSCVASKIEHVIVIVQENHSFDAYFGRYCQAAAGSNPSCDQGRPCCEGAPMANGQYVEAHGATAALLDDDSSNAASNFKADRDHDQACELQQINNGAMDQYVTGASGGAYCLGTGPKCSTGINFALADGSNPASAISYYWGLADRYAIADRYFQPIAGGTSSNDQYFASAHFQFVDNKLIPKVAVGLSTSKANRLCSLESAPGTCVDTTAATFPTDTIGGMLLDAGKTFAVYADGYAAAASARLGGSNSCPSPSDASECPYNSCNIVTGHPVACHACVYDPSDIPFLYYQRFSDHVAADGTITPTPYVKDYSALKTDIEGLKLPDFSFVKARSFRNEHPNVSTLADGVNFVHNTIDMVMNSVTYSDNTLILLTWDESGGFYDHVSPPAAHPVGVDHDANGSPVPYGPRVPLIAIGKFAKTGTVAHTPLEHSSIVKFLEWNFLTSVGQLHARDAAVNNLGSLLDPVKTGVTVPVL